LHLSIKTIETHVSAVLRKLQPRRGSTSEAGETPA
jgi:DNA-binding NarL/FixJ family response regulator